MTKDSSFHMADGIDLRGEASALYERKVDILSAIILYSSNLDNYCQEVEDRLGKKGFKKVLEGLSNSEKAVIVDYANHIIEGASHIKEMLYTHNRK